MVSRDEAQISNIIVSTTLIGRDRSFGGGNPTSSLMQIGPGTIEGDVPSGSGVGSAFVSQPIPSIPKIATHPAMNQLVPSSHEGSQIANICKANLRCSPQLHQQINQGRVVPTSRSMWSKI